MGVLAKIGRGVLSLLGAGKDKGETGNKALEIVDELHFSPQEKAVLDAQTTQVAITPQTDGFDSAFDRLGRAQRPFWAIYLAGGLTGAWKLADLSSLDATWVTLFIIYWTALFGGRAVFIDLLKGIKTLLKK